MRSTLQGAFHFYHYPLPLQAETKITRQIIKKASFTNAGPSMLVGGWSFGFLLPSALDVANIEGAAIQQAPVSG